MKIGETILKLREEKKMSQEEFAQYYHCLLYTSGRKSGETDRFRY